MKLQAQFEFSQIDYEKQLMGLLARKDKNSLIINNPAQSMFLFIDRQQLEVKTLFSKQFLFWVEYALMNNENFWCLLLSRG